MYGADEGHDEMLREKPGRYFGTDEVGLPAPFEAIAFKNKREILKKAKSQQIAIRQGPSVVSGSGSTYTATYKDGRYTRVGRRDVH